MSTPPSLRAMMQYSLLAIPLAFVGLPLYMYAPDFYAGQSGISLATLGFALLLIRLFDAVQDPFIGYISHRFAHLRHALLIASLIVMAAGVFMLFHPPATYVLLWFVVSLVMTTTAFSILTINFNSLGSLWQKDTHEKLRITSWREGFSIVGLLIAAVLPSVIGLPMMSAVFVGVLISCGMIFMVWHRRHARTIQHSAGAQVKFSLRPLQHRATRRFYGVYALSMLASAIPAVLVLFFIRERLGAEHLTGLFLLLYFVAGAAGMPLWKAIARRSQTYRAWGASMIVAIVTFIWAYFLGDGDLWQYALICVLSGVAFGAELSLPPAILSDMIEDEGTQAHTPLYFSVLAFLSKAALALGSFIAFTVIGYADFAPFTQNSDTALHALSITYALIPCAIKIVAAFLLWHYFKSEGDHNVFHPKTT